MKLNFLIIVWSHFQDSNSNPASKGLPLGLRTSEQGESILRWALIVLSRPLSLFLIYCCLNSVVLFLASTDLEVRRQANRRKDKIHHHHQMVWWRARNSDSHDRRRSINTNSNCNNCSVPACLKLGFIGATQFKLDSNKRNEGRRLPVKQIAFRGDRAVWECIAREDACKRGQKEKDLQPYLSSFIVR